MKNLSLGLNVVLFIAVAVLYYLHFNSCAVQSEQVPKTEANKTSTLSKVITDSSKARLPIAYVNIDTLNKKYKFIESVSKTAERKLKGQQQKLEAEKAKVTEEYQIFMENYQGGIYKSQAEIDQRQQYFVQKQQELAKKEYELQNSLEQEMAETNEKIMKNVTEYLKKYSTELNYSFIMATGSASSVLFAKDSLDITQPIIDGLNEEFLAK